jgi:HK97 family phage prohead protease
MSTRTLTGYGSVFDVTSRIGGAQGFDETVMRGAFRGSLSRKPDVVFRLEHSSVPLARTTSGTLALSEDSIGLRYEATLDDSDPDVAAVVPKILRGDMTESSFAFRVVKDSWNSDMSRRSLEEVDIHRGDVSLVTFGASSSTGKYTTLRGSLSFEQRSAMAKLTKGIAIVRGRVVAVDGCELRQDEPDDDDEENTKPCPSCNGTGRVDDVVCAACAGAGRVPKDDDEDDAERSSTKYSAAELASMLRRVTRWRTRRASRRSRSRTRMTSVERSGP